MSKVNNNYSWPILNSKSPKYDYETIKNNIHRPWASPIEPDHPFYFSNSIKKYLKSIKKKNIDQINYLLKNSHSPKAILYNYQRPSIVNYLERKRPNNAINTENFELIGKKIKEDMKNLKQGISKNKSNVFISDIPQVKEKPIGFLPSHQSSKKLIHKKISFTHQRSPVLKTFLNKKIKNSAKVSCFTETDDKIFSIKSDRSLLLKEKSFSLKGWETIN